MTMGQGAELSQKRGIETGGGDRQETWVLYKKPRHHPKGEVGARVKQRSPRKMSQFRTLIPRRQGREKQRLEERQADGAGGDIYRLVKRKAALMSHWGGGDDGGGRKWKRPAVCQR